MNEQLFHCKQGGTAVGRPAAMGQFYLQKKENEDEKIIK